MIITPSMAQLADALKRHAETGIYHGKMSDLQTPYFRRARVLHKSGTSLIFTRDIGHHSSGWFKNPDYERCYHLSLSFWHIPEARDHAERLVAATYNFQLADAWVHALYGDWTRYVWDESNLTHHNIDEGVFQDSPIEEINGKHEIHHYRVFCDPAWKPIIPRGEVYSKEFTEKGWKSWSDQQFDIQRATNKEPDKHR